MAMLSWETRERVNLKGYTVQNSDTLWSDFRLQRSNTHPLFPRHASELRWLAHTTLDSLSTFFFFSLMDKNEFVYLSIYFVLCKLEVLNLKVTYFPFPDDIIIFFTLVAQFTIFFSSGSKHRQDFVQLN